MDTPSGVGKGGAPGNIMFEVVVGNVDDLYKSSKPGSGRNSQMQSKNSTRRRLSIDLHGKSTDEALKSLDDSLPSWLDSAMRGSYPFVSAVDIITGGGHQILSEVVEKWIKSQRHVARRPKSFTFA
jgi:DNA-nicking Smr family endonuclease